ncbi:beta-lactamase-like protein [Aspergillus bertholletiae]|uniref:Beta-lactamase-like protein n=1 Tax=Aspergillus bertholletiae TaxID=1226010 RepID=A0A5N7AS63_9EURO|nr:beta-lactamase-like protein [Aspergillus bertholletiae]
MLAEIDDLEIHVLVNDELDPITPSMNPAVKVASQFMGIPLAPLPHGTERDGAAMEMRMDNICCAAHGISLLLIATKGDKKHYFLFDAGPEGEVWDRNSHRLRSQIGLIEHIVLSHYHRDHSGGLVRAIELIQQAKGGDEKVVMDVHPNRPDFRGVQAGIPISLEADPSFGELATAGATVFQSDQPHTVLDDFFLVSGEIPRETKYEDGIHGGLRYDATKGKWEEDTLIMDERYVMCNLKGKGLVVFTGCGHAGVINTCRNAVALGNGASLYSVVGGYHLADADDAKLNATMKDLKAFDPKVMLAGHCTGWRFKCQIAHDMPNCLVPLFSGSKYSL